MKLITEKNKLLGIIISKNFNSNGICFFTPDDFSQQLAFMKHPQGKIIEAHVHNFIKREVHYTQEVLFLRKGKLRIDFYDDSQKYIESHILQAGDIVLLASGGHGFEVLEEIEMFEVKQGPYAGDGDKTRFESVESQNIILKE